MPSASSKVSLDSGNSRLQESVDDKLVSRTDCHTASEADERIVKGESQISDLSLTGLRWFYRAESLRLCLLLLKVAPVTDRMRKEMSCRSA